MEHQNITTKPSGPGITTSPGGVKFRTIAPAPPAASRNSASFRPNSVIQQIGTPQSVQKVLHFPTSNSSVVSRTIHSSSAIPVTQDALPISLNMVSSGSTSSLQIIGSSSVLVLPSPQNGPNINTMAKSITVSSIPSSLMTTNTNFHTSLARRNGGTQEQAIDPNNSSDYFILPKVEPSDSENLTNYQNSRMATAQHSYRRPEGSMRSLTEDPGVSIEGPDHKLNDRYSKRSDISGKRSSSTTIKHGSGRRRGTNSIPLGPAGKPRKPCNCTRSMCLKLYCDCFAAGEFCQNCNCVNCYNNLSHEEHRQRAIKQTLDRNPLAFHPKIGTNANEGEGDRVHQKGCHCKRSGCLKNYCECYEAKILCSSHCKCMGCKNQQDYYDNRQVRGNDRVLDDVSDDFNNKSFGNRSLDAVLRVGSRTVGRPRVQNDEENIFEETNPGTFVTDEVMEATGACLLAQADECDSANSVVQEKQILHEFGRCLVQIIQAARRSRSMAASEVVKNATFPAIPPGTGAHPALYLQQQQQHYSHPSYSTSHSGFN